MLAEQIPIAHTRWHAGRRDGDQLVWTFGRAFTARLERVHS